MNQVAHNSLLGPSASRIERALVEEFGQPSYRARQLFEALYRQRVATAEQISTLPQDFRRGLADKGISVGLPEIEQKFVSTDGTVRYLVRVRRAKRGNRLDARRRGGEAGDGSEAGDQTETSGRTWERATICVSSQVGCAVDCQFCLTALLGIKRNLTAGEIVGQVCAVLERSGSFSAAAPRQPGLHGNGRAIPQLRQFHESRAAAGGRSGHPESRMTVSTAGIVPRIYDLGMEPVRPKLAISLNASNDDLRTRLMPINRKWNLEKLMAAAREFPLRNREKLTFEYVLLRWRERFRRERPRSGGTGSGPAGQSESDRAESRPRN